MICIGRPRTATALVATVTFVARGSLHRALPRGTCPLVRLRTCCILPRNPEAWGTGEAMVTTAGGAGRPGLAGTLPERQTLGRRHPNADAPSLGVRHREPVPVDRKRACPPAANSPTSWTSPATTVVIAYEQLIDEGYLVSHERSGVFVATAGQPESRGQPSVPTPPGAWNHRFAVRPSQWRHIDKPRDWQSHPYPFLSGQFDPALFPTAAWRESVAAASSVANIKEWACDGIDEDDPALLEQLRAQGPATARRLGRAGRGDDHDRGAAGALARDTAPGRPRHRRGGRGSRLSRHAQHGEPGRRRRACHGGRCRRRGAGGRLRAQSRRLPHAGSPVSHHRGDAAVAPADDPRGGQRARHDAGGGRLRCGPVVQRPRRAAAQEPRSRGTGHLHRQPVESARARSTPRLHRGPGAGDQ